MKLELLSSPTISHPTLARNFPAEAVAEFDSSKRKSFADAFKVISDTYLGSGRHFHFAFYFELPPDALTEILCYTKLAISREAVDDYTDSGVMSGSLEDYLNAARIFCQKHADKQFRAFFNVLLAIIEQAGVTLPFSKVDLGDQTYAVK